MEYRVLGPLEVLDGETPVEIVGSKRRTVLFLLVLHAKEVVRSERLIDDVRGDAAPRNGLPPELEYPATLSEYVSLVAA